MLNPYAFRIRSIHSFDTLWNQSREIPLGSVFSHSYSWHPVVEGYIQLPTSARPQLANLGRLSFL
jgi:hypothetical protein